MRFTNLDDWLLWQEQQHPEKIRLGLDRVGRVWKRLQPDARLGTVISVAGTNGKGSSVAMLEAILEEAGYRTACYTSPHLLRYNERIRLGARPVDDRAVCRAFDRIDDARGDTELSYFEFGTLAALDIFCHARPEILMLEVGLGGRLDAVNLIDADVALITTIDLDHMAWLGDSRETIAREKAGIMRAGRPAVVSSRQCPSSLAEEAERRGAPFYRLGTEFDFQTTGSGWIWSGGERSRVGLPFPWLRGVGQLDNAAGALMVLSLIEKRFPVSQEAVRRGLQRPGPPGRFQIIPGKVDLILDVAHNPQAARALADNLHRHPCAGVTHAVCGMMEDKDIEAVARALADAVDAWYLVPLDTERAVAPAILAERLRAGLTKQRPLVLADSVGNGLERACAGASPGDRILVFGSFLTVAAVLAGQPGGVSDNPAAARQSSLL